MIRKGKWSWREGVSRTGAILGEGRKWGMWKGKMEGKINSTKDI